MSTNSALVGYRSEFFFSLQDVSQDGMDEDSKSIYLKKDPVTLVLSMLVEMKCGM